MASLLPWGLRADTSLLPTDEQVRQILRERIDKDKRGVGIIVAMVDAKGVREVAYGGRTLQDHGSVNGGTIFEIGSITKVFTTLLLADMVAKGEVKLDDPVARYLPKEVKVPSRAGREITLLDLATHRSGLPSVPANLQSSDDANPWADYTVAQMYAFLSSYELPREIGAKFEYSNLGVGLLGHALALRAGKSYEALVIERICDPLGMLDTRITLTKAMHNVLAAPYDKSLTLTKNWDCPTIAGAGALRSDANDLLKFLEAELNLVDSPFAPGSVQRDLGKALGRPATPLTSAMQETRKSRNKTDEAVMEIGLGWLINKRYDPPMIWHNGGTGGYRSFIGFCPEKKTGVVVLSNSALGVDDIGFHLLDERYELQPPLKERTALKIKPETADRYLGKYEVVPQFALTFTREGDRYFVQATDQDKDEVFPEAETRFFSKSFDGQIEFVKDAQGKYSSLILHQGGMPDQSARRLP